MEAINKHKITLFLNKRNIKVLTFSEKIVATKAGKSGIILIQTSTKSKDEVGFINDLLLLSGSTKQLTYVSGNIFVTDRLKCYSRLWRGFMAIRRTPIFKNTSNIPKTQNWFIKGVSL